MSLGLFNHHYPRCMVIQIIFPYAQFFCWIGFHFFLSSISIFLYEKLKRIGNFHLCLNSLLYNELCTPIANLFLCPILFSSKHLKFSYNLVYYAFGFAPCHFHCTNTKNLHLFHKMLRVANLTINKIGVPIKNMKVQHATKILSQFGQLGIGPLAYDQVLGASDASQRH